MDKLKNEYFFKNYNELMKVPEKILELEEEIEALKNEYQYSKSVVEDYELLEEDERDNDDYYYTLDELRKVDNDISKKEIELDKLKEKESNWEDILTLYDKIELVNNEIVEVIKNVPDENKFYAKDFNDKIYIYDYREILERF